MRKRIKKIIHCNRGDHGIYTEDDVIATIRQLKMEYSHPSTKRNNHPTSTDVDLEISGTAKQWDEFHKLLRSRF